jgi:ribosomal protein S18 acetylase RimI-like enzyme
MNVSNLQYKTKTASEDEINLLIKECNSNFIPHLDEKVNLKEYAKKLFGKSITFEAWDDTTLVGLVAAYFNDSKDWIGYISNVSVIRAYTGIGIASNLMQMCVNYAKLNKYKEIKLEVNKKNIVALKLYEKNGFKETKEEECIIRMTLSCS